MSKYIAHNKLWPGIRITVNKFLLLFFFVFAFYLPAAARDIPAPPSVERQSLGEIKRDIEKRKDLSKNLQKTKLDLDKDIAAHKAEMVDQSQLIQKLEARLWELDQDIQANSQQKDVVLQKLQSDRHQISGFIQALDHMDRVPMVAVLARYGSALEIAQTHSTMQDLTRQFAGRLQDLKSNLELLQDLSETLDRDYKESTEEKSKLDKAYAVLQDQLIKKDRLFKEAERDIALQDQTIKELAQRSTNISALITSLDKAEKKAKAAAKAKRQARAAQAFKAPSFSSFKNAGQGTLPVAGALRVGYGQKDFLDATSQGVWVEGAPGGLVTAPYSGEIRFAGEFKSYGQLVIIEHSNGVHSLISGFGKIIANVGENISAGEAIGYIGKKKTGSYRDFLIYYELRKSGKTVDPTRGISL